MIHGVKISLHCVNAYNREMEISKKSRKTKQRVVFLTNIIPPYRNSLFEILFSQLDEFYVLFDSKNESGRSWDYADSELFIKKNVSIRIKAKFLKRGTDLHVPVGLYVNLMKLKPDLIISNELGIRTVFAVLYSKMTRRTKVIAWLNLSELTEMKYGGLRHYLRRKLLQNIVVCICSSTSAMRYLKSLDFEGRIFVEHQAIDWDLPYTGKKLVDNLTLNLLFVAGDPRRKNFESISEIARWAEKNRKFVCLAVMGNVPSIKDKHLEENHYFRVNRIGFLQSHQIQKLYQSVDYLFFPTLEDEWGIVVNESLSASKPVLGSIHSEAVQELIIDGKNGFVFDPKHESGVISVLERAYLSKNDGSYNALAVNAYKTSQENSIAKYANAFFDAINEATRSKKVLFHLPYMNKYKSIFFARLYSCLEEKNIQLRHSASIPERNLKSAEDSEESDITQNVNRLFLWDRNGRKMSIRFNIGKLIRYDLVVLEHAIGNLESYFVIALRRLLKKPTAIWGHGYTITKRRNFLTILLQKWMVKNTDLYLAYTEKSAERAKSLGGQNTNAVPFLNKSSLYYLSQDFEPRIIKGKLKSSNKPNLWQAVFIGTNTPDKEIMTLIQLAQSIHESNPSFRLAIIGGRSKEVFDDIRNFNFITLQNHTSPSEIIKNSSNWQIIMSTGRVGLLAADSIALMTPLVFLNSNYHAPEREYLNNSNSIACNSINEMKEKVLSLMTDNEKLMTLKRGCFQSYSLMNEFDSVKIVCNAIDDVL